MKIISPLFKKSSTSRFFLYASSYNLVLWGFVNCLMICPNSVLVTPVQLIESGEKERLKELLRERLIECGWRDEMKALCRFPFHF
jgi:hypothetical protein